MNKGRLGFFSLLALTVFVLSAGSALAQNSTGTAEFPPDVLSALTQASYVGHHDPASVLKLTVALKLRNIQQLHKFLSALRDPTSPEYGHFLTP